MASLGHSAGATTQSLPTHVVPVPCSLLHLPAPLLELVLQHLSLAQQLNHCSHLCHSLSPLTSNSLRYAPLLLTDDTVRHIGRSPRLTALVSSASRVELHIDKSSHKLAALHIVVSTPHTKLLFPQLDTFSVRLSSVVLTVGHHAQLAVHVRAADVVRQPAVLTSLTSFLSTRSTTLRSLHIDTLSTLVVLSELPSTLAPLSALRRLCVTTRTASLSAHSAARRSRPVQ